jgi:hypothetical protein
MFKGRSSTKARGQFNLILLTLLAVFLSTLWVVCSYMNIYAVLHGKMCAVMKP